MAEFPKWPFPNVHIFWYSWGDQKPGEWCPEDGCVQSDTDTAGTDDEVVVYPRKGGVTEEMLQRAARWLRKHGYKRARVAKTLYTE